MPSRRSRRIAMSAALVLTALAATPSADQVGRGSGPGVPAALPVDPLRFRYLGPAPAGRIASAVGVPGDPSTYYLGAASGGIWKSTDRGATFVPIFDNQPVAAIGALALAPSDANIVWAGTGEPWVIRPSDVIGDGVYKSIDAGKTWQHAGLADTGRISRIVVHPTNPAVVFVCAVGRATGPQQERGLFRTETGGTSWQRVLFVNADTGCSGLSMDAANPNVLVAGMWQIEQHTWAQFSGGVGSGVYVSRDGGTRWTAVDNGLPKPPVGKIDVAIAPSNSKRVYALIQTADQGSLWRSDDAGASFKAVSWDRSLIGRGGYSIRLAVNPQNADGVLVANGSLHRSNDGGSTFSVAGGCGDCHDIWMDPKDPRRYVLTDDAGASIVSPQGNATVRLPIGQMYHVAVDNRVPYWIYSNRQDGGTMRGPSTTPEQTGNGRLTGSAASTAVAAGGRGAPAGRGRGAVPPAWETGLGGCGSGFTIPDPTDASIVWATCYGNRVTRWDARTRTARSVSPWMITLDSPPAESRYRCHWTAPIAFDPFDHATVYYGCQVIFKTSNGGQSWDVISPDLSTGDPSRVVSSGGIVGDNRGQFAGEVVYAIAASSVRRGVIWAGTNDGRVWITRDVGTTWTDVTKNVHMPAWGTVTQIHASTFDAGAAYIAVDYHLMDNREPFIFRTSDYGQTWTKVTGDLPSTHPLDYVLSVAENPNRQGMLFAGTGHAFYYSMDGGGHWTRFRDGLPPAPVTWIVVEPRSHDVVVSTYGRGLFVLPNISVFEQTGQTAFRPGTTLYTPRPGIRQARTGSAEFVFSLGAPPATPVQMQIFDESDQLIRTELVQNARAGLNRVVWDLRYDAPRPAALRTTPTEHPRIWDEPRFQNRDTRGITHWGVGGTTATPIAAPGRYTVRLILENRPFTQPFEVIADPAIGSPDADLVESTKMQVRIRDAINDTSEVVNRIEVVRRQIEDLLREHRGRDEFEKPLADLDRKILDVELRLVTRSDMLSDDQYFVEAYKVYLNLLWLGGAVGTGAGDEAGGADARPRDAAYQILGLLEQQLAAAKAGFAAIIEKDLPEFNRAMAGRLPEIRDR
jgi:hypothetical protein